MDIAKQFACIILTLLTTPLNAVKSALDSACETVCGRDVDSNSSIPSGITDVTSTLPPDSSLETSDQQSLPLPN